MNQFKFRILCCTWALVVSAAPVLAQGTANTSAVAEDLFQQGRELFRAGNYAAACPKLAASQELEPATGTLITLALCHENQGKLASAWAEFVAVADRAKQEANAERERVASSHAAALRPRLSSLAVDVPNAVASVAGFTLKLDGMTLAPGAFGTPVTVDGGEHQVEVTATDKQPFRATITLKVEGDAQRVSVPMLVPMPAVAHAQPLPQPLTPSVSQPPRESSPPSAEARAWTGGWRTVGLVTAGAGIVGIGVGSYLGLTALSDYNAAVAAGNSVGPAQDKGNVATAFWVAGPVLLAGGLALWWFTPAPTERTANGASEPVRVERVGLGPQGITVTGRF